jgi:hypothetical protein
MGMISKFCRVVSTWKIETSTKWKFLAGKIIETSNAEWWISAIFDHWITGGVTQW